MRPLINTFWLTGKELKSVLGDPVMVILIAWSFVVAVMLEAQGAGDTVRNASIAIVDEDRSPLSRQISDALAEPAARHHGAASSVEAGITPCEDALLG